MCLFLFAAKSVLHFLLEGGSHWLGLPNDLEEFQENSPIFQSWDAFFRCLLVGRLQVFFEKKHMHILYGKKTVDVKCWCGGFWIWKSFAVLGCFGSNICCWMFFRSLVWNVYSKNDSSFALTFMYRFFTGTTYCKYIYIHTYIPHVHKVIQTYFLLETGARLDLAGTVRYLYTFSSQPWRYKLAGSHWTLKYLDVVLDGS